MDSLTHITESIQRNNLIGQLPCMDAIQDINVYDNSKRKKDGVNLCTNNKSLWIKRSIFSIVSASNSIKDVCRWHKWSLRGVLCRDEWRTVQTSSLHLQGRASIHDVVVNNRRSPLSINNKWSCQTNNYFQ